MADVLLTVDPGRAADAGHFFAAGQQLLHLLDELTDTESQEHDWEICDLRLGSAVVGLRSTAPARVEAADRMLEGLWRARSGEDLPVSWTPSVTTAAQALVKSLGDSTAQLKVSDNVVFIDSRLATHLRQLTPWVREMPGSLRGTLTGFNINRGNRASLKMESGRVIRCSFPTSEAQHMADSLMKFVEIEGTVRQDGDGLAYWIKAESIRVVPDAPMPWEELFGFDPNATDGMPVADYLAMIRGDE